MNSDLNDALSVYYYENLREKIYNIINILNQSIKSLNNIEGTISDKFCIDDVLVKEMNFNSVNDMLKNRVSYLNNTIIPSINSKINSLK